MAHTPTVTDDALKVGDRIVLRIAGVERRGVVIEDRGPLGVAGRQVVAVHLDNEEDGSRFEMGAELLERVAA